jgi:signal transduction histidine kinase
MRRFANLSVRQKIAASTFVVIAFITAVSWLSIQLIVFPNLTRQIVSRGLTIAESIAARAQRYLTANDKPNLLDVMFTEKWMNPNLLYIFVLDASHRVVAHTFLSDFPDALIQDNILAPGQGRQTRLIETSMGSVYDTALGLYEGIHPIATVRVGLSKGSIDQVIHPLVQILLGLLTLVITIAVFLSTWFSRQITDPITQLSNLAGEVSRGKFGESGNLRALVKCWKREGWKLSACPAYERGAPPCWLRDDVPGQEGGELDSPEERPLKCLDCQVYQTEAGDEIAQLGDAFCHMLFKLDLYQRELRQTNEDLRKLNRSYMDMLSFVTHELKTPIANSTMSAHSVLQRIFGPLTPMQERMVGLICRNLDQSMTMIRNYLDLSRIEKDELRFTPLILRLGSEVVEPVLAELSAMISAHGMEVESTVGEDVVLEGDSELLRVVYRNLVGNGCKYGRAGGRIRLRAIDEGDRYRFEVWNDGQGVAQEQMERLFQKFTRIAEVQQGANKGTGLGLFICRTIVNRHGGKIWAEGQEGEWINFIFELPKSQGRSLVS